jgi:hypothetical protein
VLYHLEIPPLVMNETSSSYAVYHGKKGMPLAWQSSQEKIEAHNLLKEWLSSPSTGLSTSPPVGLPGGGLTPHAIFEVWISGVLDPLWVSAWSLKAQVCWE